MGINFLLSKFAMWRLGQLRRTVVRGGTRKIIFESRGEIETFEK
jgi:hypothetical protein